MPFLTAQWRDLLFLNYEVEPGVLEPHLPPGTELDPFGGQHLLTVVGFRFVDTHVWGLPALLHRTFEEVNLRFYVRRKTGEDWRRGVAFVKEIVPKPVVAALARRLFHEHYHAYPMRHRVHRGDMTRPTTVEYWWYPHERLNHLRATTSGAPRLPEPDSLEAFVTQHYWGYAARPGGGALEYRVEHPPWPVQPVTEAALDCDVPEIYGEAFADALSQDLQSGFFAEGSKVAVHRGVRI